ncbi:C2H2 type zinc finger containing protein [Hirsutella rhossiliensis]|uniref:C2H2 type zinc finger containing protein n=1 Tax=Hirsutella rhossiliensis TaxID=111463 RepID=A0A9P8SEH1_9HYPO|nr:C2H2 type zinc finger containing protein [Hirsutella rhossiliensis]KAH0958385.1 C2H2 type zinc finger containing protein [Hirsutella rhossiliensis]
MVDAGSPTNEPSLASQTGSPRAEVAGSTSYHTRQETPYADSRPASSYTKSWQQRGMPPTPPMGADAAFDSYSSPLSKPVNLLSGVSAGASGRFYETTPPLETDFHRHSIGGGRPPVRHQSFSPSPFSTQPPQPLPQSFPPLSIPVVVAPSSGANPWQHHHYLSPSHGAGYAQNQDRYICQTCNKAFSRPSSLRIHSHSHTGEKPFKCPHAGCGKAFSVRSNMKRHERGCHSFDAGSARTSHVS